jgi:hypothetical protein
LTLEFEGERDDGCCWDGTVGEVAKKRAEGKGRCVDGVDYGGSKEVEFCARRKVDDTNGVHDGEDEHTIVAGVEEDTVQQYVKGYKKSSVSVESCAHLGKGTA